jgi:beta-N-acetylhexosaminidase
MVSDNLGSRAFRRFMDPTGQSFNARIIARDAFSTTGNDLLFLGSEFIDTGDPDTYTTIVRTLDFFAKKYREDPSFQQRVDESVLRILTLKYRLYQNIFALDQVLPPQNALGDIGKSEDVTFNVAQSAATLISPSLDELPNVLPQPPGLNDRIVFLSDARSAQQCIECSPQPAFDKNALEKAVIQLYGPLAGGQALQRNLKSYTFKDLLALLDHSDKEDTKQLESDLNQADWLVFSMLNVSTNIPESSALSRFLAERPDLFQQKKLVVFAFDAPYFLDSTEISKLSAYYGLYSKTNKFVEVAARLLYGEIPAPPGNLPVSVAGIDYDLITETSPDPNQTILLFLDRPESTSEGTLTPEPTLAPEFETGDLIAVRTGEIIDHNGHPVPDDTPVKFTMTIDGETTKTTVQNEKTVGGIASTTFLIEQAGTLEIRAESISATESTLIRYEIPPNGNGEILPTLTAQPTPTSTISPTATAQPVVEENVLPPLRDKTDLGDWFLAILVTFIFGGIVYWLTSQVGLLRWSVRGSLLALIGGLLAYTYLAIGMPGTVEVLQSSGTWGVLFITLFGSILGWGTALGWHRVQDYARNHQLPNDRGQQAE